MLFALRCHKRRRRAAERRADAMRERFMPRRHAVAVAMLKDAILKMRAAAASGFMRGNAALYRPRPLMPNVCRRPQRIFE